MLYLGQLCPLHQNEERSVSCFPLSPVPTGSWVTSLLFLISLLYLSIWYDSYRQSIHANMSLKGLSEHLNAVTDWRLLQTGLQRGCLYLYHYIKNYLDHTLYCILTFIWSFIIILPFWCMQPPLIQHISAISWIAKRLYERSINGFLRHIKWMKLTLLKAGRQGAPRGQPKRFGYVPKGQRSQSLNRTICKRIGSNTLIQKQSHQRQWQHRGVLWHNVKVTKMIYYANKIIFWF